MDQQKYEQEWEKARQREAAIGVLLTAQGYVMQSGKPPKAVRDQLRFYLDRVWR